MLLLYDLGIYVTDGMFCMKGITSVPKSVLRYSMDKVRQGSETKVWYSTASYVQKYLSMDIYIITCAITIG